MTDHEITYLRKVIEILKETKVGPNPPVGDEGYWLKLGNVGVDSASIGIVDPVHVRDEGVSMPVGTEFSAQWCGQMGVRFWSGLGDGGYDVWGWITRVGEGGEGNPDFRIAQVVMTLIDEQELEAWNSDLPVSVDVERARELFERVYYVNGDSGIVSDAVNHEAIELLKTDPDEYFRLSRIWRDGFTSGVLFEGREPSE